MEKTSKTPAPAPSKGLSWEWFTDDFYLRYSRELWVGLAVVLAAAAGYFAWTQHRDRADEESNKKLGAAYVLLNAGRLFESEQSLKGFLAENPSGIAADKVWLYLGKVYYDEQKYDEALDAYGKVRKGSKDAALLYSGALHGEAACYMQKKDYAAAVKSLDALVSRYQVRTGKPGDESVDLAPDVPNALWKEALCYRELQQPQKAREIAESLRKAYPGTREASDADKLLALLD